MHNVIVPDQPAMEPVEIDCFRRVLSSCRSLVEYGSGGSTLFALKAGVAEIFSVECDREWANAVLRDARSSGYDAVQITSVNIGKTGKWGYPTNWRGNVWTRRQRARYVMCPWRSGPLGMIRSDRKPDVVLIDGRYRVACIAATALNAPPGAVIVVHDFWGRDREYYEPALPLLQPIEKAGSLGVFRISNATYAVAKGIRATYRNDPR